jgi:hypothetical protein
VCAGCLAAQPAGAACPTPGCGALLARLVANAGLAKLIDELPLPRCPRQPAAAPGPAAGAKRARQDDSDDSDNSEEEGGNGASGSGAKGGGCAWRGCLGQLAAHRLTCALEPVRCAVPGCAFACTRAELDASPLGASHGAHVAVLSTRAERAEALLAAAAQREAALRAQLAGAAGAEAQLADAHAALRLRPARITLNAAKKQRNWRAIAAVMRAHVGDAAVQASACELLYGELDAGRVKAAADKAGIVALALDAMRRHRTKADVQAASLDVLCYLANYGRSCAEIGLAGVDAALAALRRHATHESACARSPAIC